MVIRRPVPFHWLKNGLALVYKLHWKEFFRFTDSIQNLGVKLSMTNIQAADAHAEDLTTGVIPPRRGGTRELTGNADIDKHDALGVDAGDASGEEDPGASLYAVHRAARGRVIAVENSAMAHVLAGWDAAVQELQIDDEERTRRTQRRRRRWRLRRRRRRWRETKRRSAPRSRLRRKPC